MRTALHYPALVLLTIAGACTSSSPGESDTSSSTGAVSLAGSDTGSDTSSGTATEPTTGVSATTTDITTSTSTSTTDTDTGTSTSTTEVGTSTSTGPDSDASTAPISDTGTTLVDTTDSGEPGCVTLLDATVRDFKSDHPDFEKFGGTVDGLVKPDLGPDKKPVHAADGPTSVTSGPANFNQWYNDVPGVNQTLQIQLQLMEVMPGIYQYKNSSFFPLDDQAFGNQGNNHNFHFTTEIHTEFVYYGGEKFTFTGDDDLWMFINGKLAIDLGGVHGELSETIDLDASAANLGIVKDGVYTMDIFHAERHTTQSNFRIDTTIGCFVPN